jgi:hypothetical protein
MKRLKFWVWQNLIAVDQLLNTLFFGGWADETMSSAVYRMERDGHFWGFMRKAVDAVAALFGDKSHCAGSYESERARSQLPPEYRVAPSATTSKIKES